MATPDDAKRRHHSCLHTDISETRQPTQEVEIGHTSPPIEVNFRSVCKYQEKIFPDAGQGHFKMHDSSEISSADGAEQAGTDCEMAIGARNKASLSNGGKSAVIHF